ncbi:ring-cleaving dioxygenase [Roseobacter denitrificans]|uniref:Glyoxylase family protein n=1 Tax=Roseobacter denitrificans (strain ATCC 33942 / OCh 114) TaxID=375451 RepID=Q16CP3_ROSDO|nr:ring-cleaving dioxygenase [Roseobacter denitrificans]ABG30250.1 glyoxylase family protein [Roseobacter denitrificans OCh 114]AVL53431.1 ring-cleaving dioxygenase [Roseobacter denitrificans]SFF70965.1 glyoxalase family protein [Roseobacter denitrificans OCh 114]
MDKKRMNGLHHITAISGPPQANADFFTKVMQQRLVKKTVNFDDPGTYHLYYGNETADPGTILTFFPFVNAGPGRAGPGMASAYAYAVGRGGFDTWMERLALETLDFDGPTERFGSRVIRITDPDGAKVELIEVDGDDGPTLDGFHSVTLQLNDLEPTQRLLTDVMGYDEVAHKTGNGEERLRLQLPGDARGRIVDLMRADVPSIGRQGAGSIHHVAFRALDDEDQLDWRERLLSAGMDVTPVIDRQYFNAIYFREPGGVLFEIATDPPGFTRDEDLAHLGRSLQLPAQYESARDRIEQVLPPLVA